MSKNKNSQNSALELIDSFGEVAAEDEPVLDYFLSTDTLSKIEQMKALLVLGRKGSGKTALVRYLSETDSVTTLSSALSFKSYPWSVHAQIVDRGASASEAHLASWTLFLAIEVAKMAYMNAPDKNSGTTKRIGGFLRKNYGTTRPDTADLLRPDKLELSGTLEPTLFGSKLGQVALTPSSGIGELGRELHAVSDSLIQASKSTIEQQMQDDTFLIHLDELDQGLDQFDDTRSSMLTGLILAARNVRNLFSSTSARVSPIVYLRTDLWEKLRFSDKNKIAESSSLHIEWDHQQLKDMIELRATAKAGHKVSWEDMDDGELMRGSQKKWRHIVSRTYLRPRDCIKFCNEALQKVRSRDSGVWAFTNRDITSAREAYSDYLKRELDDEISPHWTYWTDALDALSDIQRVTFDFQEFEKSYSKRTRTGNPGTRDALEMLFGFGVLGYQRRSGYGGSEWVFRYERSDTRWDRGADYFKIHLGLKEYCRLKEERS